MARALRIWFAALALSLAALLLALAQGGGAVDWQHLPRLLWTPDDSAASQVLHQLRLPRALAAWATGGLLALAGALMQVLLRNPLAEPYVLGISGGAAVGALAALLLAAGGLLVPTGAFVGALAATAIVFALARRDLAGPVDDTADAAPRLLLSGVMLAALCTALITLMLTLAPEAQVRGMLFWLAGDLSGAEGGLLPCAALVALTLAAWPLARALNLQLRGGALAHTLGVRVAATRRAVFLIASLATAVAVTTSGAVGFVGLVVPHALRLLIGNDQRVLLPACALAGGAYLLAADTLARTLIAPQQLPVGVVTALVGVPLFLLLLRTRRS